MDKLRPRFPSFPGVAQQEARALPPGSHAPIPPTLPIRSALHDDFKHGRLAADPAPSPRLGRDRKHSLPSPHLDARLAFEQAAADHAAAPVLRACLSQGGGDPERLLRIRRTLRNLRDLLPAPVVGAFAQALVMEVVGKAHSPSQGLQQLLDHVLRPLSPHLLPEVRRAFAAGVATACDALVAAAASSHRRRALVIARDELARSLAFARLRTAGAGARWEGGAPPVSPSLLCRQPDLALRYAGPGLDDACRLGLFAEALQRSPVRACAAQVEAMAGRILANVPQPLWAGALSALMAVAGDHVPQGRWRLQVLGGPTVAAMEDMEMTGALADCEAALQQSADQAVRYRDTALSSPLRRGQGPLPATPLPARTRAFADDAVSRAAQRRMDARQADALAAAVARVLRFHASFDMGHRPAYLLARADWLRAQGVPRVSPAMATLAQAVADALERRADALRARQVRGRP